jgi:uncharacterized protein
MTSELERIPPEVAERLGYYVYLYVDPRTNKPFYVGKGQGQRALSHLGLQNESKKTQIISDLSAEGKQPRIDILVHELPDEQTAFCIEAAVIDALGLADLANEVRGWDAVENGRRSLAELITIYAATPVEIVDPVLLIRIRRLFRPDMTWDEIYEATRGVWRIGVRRERAKYALAVFDGIVREVFEIKQWHPAGTTTYPTRNSSQFDPARWEFTGSEAPPEVHARYLGRSVSKYLSPKMQTPFKYVNC